MLDRDFKLDAIRMTSEKVIPLHEGDIAICNNYTVFMGALRTSRSPTRGAKRILMRIWLETDGPADRTPTKLACGMA